MEIQMRTEVGKLLPNGFYRSDPKQPRIGLGDIWEFKEWWRNKIVGSEASSKNLLHISVNIHKCSSNLNMQQKYPIINLLHASAAWRDIRRGVCFYHKFIIPIGNNETINHLDFGIRTDGVVHTTSFRGPTFSFLRSFNWRHMLYFTSRNWNLICLRYPSRKRSRRLNYALF